VIALGNFLFRWRNYLFPVLIIGLCLASRPVPTFGTAAGDVVADAFGVVLILAGQALRAAVIGFQYIRRGGREGRVAADHLVTGGFFAHCRNPLYVGNYLVLAGLFVVHGSPWCVIPGLVIFAIAYASLILAEEAFLAGKFGAEYADYRARVNRIVPDFRGLSRTLEGSTYDWRQVLRKEYGSTMAWVTMLLGLLAWEHRDRLSPDGLRALLVSLAACWLVAFAFWATVRTLKKSGTLGG
jgi:protein-S-isoprenylcysteine O-methyltransferase Ste14